jgi:hypothetical protein
MSIFYFEMQGLNEKQKKSEKMGPLCRVYAHDKGPNGHFAVCIHTAKSPRGGHLCVLGAGKVRAGMVFAMRASRRRTAKVSFATHGKEAWHGKGCTHGKEMWHGNRKKRTAKFSRTATV